jgi:hypothetical protein
MIRMFARLACAQIGRKFNHTFRRDDDVVKLGFTVALSPPRPAAAPTYPVKAPRSK